MVIKLIGMIIITASTTLTGIYASNQLSEHKKRIQVMILMIDRIASLIEFRALKTGDILKTIASDKSFESLEFLKTADEYYNKGYSFYESWNQAVMSDEKAGDEEKQQLITLGNSLGTSNIKGQLSMLKIYRQNMENIFNTFSQESMNKGKLYRSLGILAGVFISVMLV